MHLCRLHSNLLQHTVAVKADGVRELHLDTREVEVSGVNVNGQGKSWRAELAFLHGAVLGQVRGGSGV